VPSPLHDQIVSLLRGNPGVVFDLLGAAAAGEVPAGASAVCASETFSTQVEDYRADAVIEVRDEGGKIVRVVVVEIQLGRDPRKVFALPVYQAVARSRYEVLCEVVVVAPDARLANAMRRPIPLGARSVFQAIVVGPEELRPELARRSPELAFLCALAHGSEEPELVLEAARLFDELPGERGALLLELVLAALPAGTRELLEVMMQSGQYEYKSAYLRGLLERGRTEGRVEGRVEGREEGRTEGRVEGTRAALLAVLAARGLAPSDEVRARIEACTDGELLQRWISRAASATSEDEVFAD
jgi:hypothetical protein